MRRAPWVLAVCFGLLSGCGPADPERAHFKGTWKHTVENGITGRKDEALVDAVVDGKKFRLTTRTAELQDIEVYDGKMLYEKIVPVQPETAAQPVDPALPEGVVPYKPETTEKAVADYETNSRRFWAHALVRHGQPGGLVAGRSSILSEAREHRMDGDMSEQSWVDAETGVLLRRLVSIYSSQVRSMVTQDTWDCQSIDFSPVSPDSFQKP